MKRRMVRIGFGFILIAAVAVAAAGFVTMSLWNWLTPALFGLPVIGFGQALGLLLLTRLLFGGFKPGRGHGMHWRERIRERMGKMTPEQREALRATMCGRRRPAEPAAQV